MNQQNDIPVTYLGNGKYKLTKSYTINTSIGNYTIPRNFVTNFATVPSWLQFIIPTRGKYDRATLLHDYFCNVNNRYKVLAEGKSCADDLFYEIMKKDGVNWIVRNIFYYAVRLSGERWIK